jgi:uncharacterized protein YbjT (DUF2867 family)
MDLHKPILVTGASGYVGGRLVPRLLAEGYRVRAMGRSKAAMAARPWASNPQVELIQGDVLEEAALHRACQDCAAAYYLVHSMIAQKGRFAEADRRGARNMRLAAEQARLHRLIYLSGLGERDDPRLSHHLASRHEVGDILASGSVPVITLRAAMILGSGSASFEILRHLVDRLPVMITPRWVETPTQPIAIANVLDYLAGCLRISIDDHTTFDIGGPDIVNYRDLIAIYAQETGLPRRRILPVPVLTPRLSAAWIHLVTPVPAAIARPLTEGLGVPTLCSENRIRERIPTQLTSCREAIRQALQEGPAQAQVCRPDDAAGRPPEWSACGDAGFAGPTQFSLHYWIPVRAACEQIWPLIEGIGGANGYYFAQALWRLRGRLDCLAGGPGLKRGRCAGAALRTGDVVDFWRVGKMRPLREVQLESEMRAPGRAMLVFELQPRETGCALHLRAYFRPRGLGGMLYWIFFLPVHDWLFRGLLRALAHRSGDPSPGAVKGSSAAERNPRI